MAATADSVISCPHCLRQYAVDASLDGRTGQCNACKSHFVVSMATLSPPADDPVVFDREIGPHISFLREGCAELGRNVCDLILLAGDYVLVNKIRAIIKTIPRNPEELVDKQWREGECNQTLASAFRASITPESKERVEALLDYFLAYLPNRPRFARDMLDSAFLGVLDSVNWDEIARNLIPGLDETPPWFRPGPIERWAARRRW